MKPSIKMILLVLCVGIAGVLVGRGIRSPQTPPVKPAAASTSPQAMAAREASNSAKIGSEPRRTFIGPEGKTHLIDYRPDTGKQAPVPPTRKAVLDGILSDMRHHPKPSGLNYGMTAEQMAAFLKAPDQVPPQVEATLPAQ